MSGGDIDPGDIDPDTGRPYPGYSSPALDTSFHDVEMDVGESGGRYPAKRRKRRLPPKRRPVDPG